MSRRCAQCHQSSANEANILRRTHCVLQQRRAPRPVQLIAKFKFTRRRVSLLVVVCRRVGHNSPGAIVGQCHQWRQWPRVPGPRAARPGPPLQLPAKFLPASGRVPGHCCSPSGPAAPSQLAWGLGQPEAPRGAREVRKKPRISSRSGEQAATTPHTSHLTR